MAEAQGNSSEGLDGNDQNEWRIKPEPAESWLLLRQEVYHDSQAFVDRYRPREIIIDGVLQAHPDHVEDSDDLSSRMFHRTAEGYRFGFTEGLHQAQELLLQMGAEADSTAVQAIRDLTTTPGTPE